MNAYLWVHIVISLLIGVSGGRKVNRQRKLCNFVVALSFPVGGYLICMLLAYAEPERSDKQADDDVANALVLFTDRANRDKDTNVVPLEETLLLNETKVKRRQLLDMLKGDASRYLDMLRLALRNEDAETSHYAATAIAEIRRNLDLSLQALSLQFEQNQHDEELLIQYAVVLQEYITSGPLDQQNRLRVLSTYIVVLKNLINLRSSPDHYEDLIEALFLTKDYQTAGQVCRAFLANYESEAAYLGSLKYYYLIKDKANFDATLRRMQASKVQLTTKGLGVVRYWRGGAEV